MQSRRFHIVLAVFMCLSLVMAPTAFAGKKVAGPKVTACDPAIGPVEGGTAVTISGRNFAGDATVEFGGAAAACTVVDDRAIDCTAPAHAAGAVDITVTNGDGTSGSLSAGFTYEGIPVDPPVVDSCTPNTGTDSGGTDVAIAGTNFVAGATVDFGGVAAANVTVVDSTNITCTTPAHAAGAVDITVTNPDSTSGSLSGGFTYEDAPVLPGVVQASWADPADGNHIVIAGEETILKAVATDPAAVSYEWDVDGDGTADSGLLEIVDPYVLEAPATYAAPGTLNATITVYDALGTAMGSDDYAIQVVDPADPDIVNYFRLMAIENGLWWLHTELTRKTTPPWSGGAPYAELNDDYDQGNIFDAQAFVDAGFLVTGSPDNPYTEDVKQMVNFVTQWLGIMPLDDKDGGYDPEGRAAGPVDMIDGLGVWFASVDETEYGFGPALKLLATCGYGVGDYPVAFNNKWNFASSEVTDITQWNYVQIMQQMVDWIAWAQLVDCGNNYSRSRPCLVTDPVTGECTSYDTGSFPNKKCGDIVTPRTIKPGSQGGWPYEREGWGWNSVTGQDVDGQNGFLGDSSITYWTYMGIEAAKNIGLAVPGYVKNDMKSFVGDNQAPSGSMLYGPLDNFHMVERAGLGLSLMKWAGLNNKKAAVKAARDFIKTYWNNHNYRIGQDHDGIGSVCDGTDPYVNAVYDLTPECYSHFYFDNIETGYNDCYYDEFGVWTCDFILVGYFDDLNLHAFKVITEGLQAYGFADVPDPVVDISYRDRYLQLLIDNQYPNGSWDDKGWIRGEPFGTAWAIQTLLMLE